MAIPAISSGIFGYPKPKCAETLFDVVQEFALSFKSKANRSIERVHFTNFDQETVDIFSKEFRSRYFSRSGD